MNSFKRLKHLAGPFCILLGIAGCREAPGTGMAAGRGATEPRTVSVEPARIREVERTITAFGSFLAREQATLSTKVQGRLASIQVDLGSKVRAGAELARMELREYELRVRQAEAALAQARARIGLASDDDDSTVDPETTSVVRQAAAVLQEARSNRDRLVRLQQEGVLSQAELDAAEAAFTVAENRHQDALEDVRQRIALVAQRAIERDIAAQQLADTTLTAPFNAAVQERRASPGEYLRIGDPVLTLVQVDPLRLRLEVSERESPKVEIGQPVRVRVEGVERQFEGQIQRISPAIDQQRRVLLVEADIANDGTLHPGMFARADIVIRKNDPALTVPASSLVAFAGIEKVYLIADGLAVERVVVTGAKNSEWVEITSNLDPGEKVILTPGKLQSGQAVVIGTSAGMTAPGPQS